MSDFMVKCGTTVEVEIYGATPAQAVQVLLPHDRYYKSEQLTDEFEDDGETFFVFSVIARDVPSTPCGLGIVVNSKEVIKLSNKITPNLEQEQWWNAIGRYKEEEAMILEDPSCQLNGSV
jgi:hypothetical protein